MPPAGSWLSPAWSPPCVPSSASALRRTTLLRSGPTGAVDGIPEADAAFSVSAFRLADNDGQQGLLGQKPAPPIDGVAAARPPVGRGDQGPEAPAGILASSQGPSTGSSLGFVV